MQALMYVLSEELISRGILARIILYKFVVSSFQISFLLRIISLAVSDHPVENLC